MSFYFSIQSDLPQFLRSFDFLVALSYFLKMLHDKGFKTSEL